MFYAEPSLKRMRSVSASLRENLNKVDQILAVVADDERIDWRDMADLAAQADELRYYAKVLSDRATYVAAIAVAEAADGRAVVR